MEENNINKTVEVVKKATSQGFVESLVLNIVEKSLPILFWIGFFGIIVFTYSMSSFATWGGKTFELTTFLVLTFIYEIALIFSFYFIYVIKNIRNSLMNLANK